MNVVIFGRPDCSYCVKAKQLAGILVEANAIAGYRYVDIYEAEISKEDLGLIVGRPVTTVPQIVIGANKEYVGGFTEFQQRFPDHRVTA